MSGNARGFVATPLGPVWVEVSGDAVTRVGWGEVAARGADPLLTRALDALHAYFDRTNTDFDLPMRPAVTGPTARVLEALRAIPFGETRTYGELARTLGAPAQAVGQACGANPIPILIPCHRVLAAGGLGGFSAPGGIETKVALLKHEGAASLLL